MNKKIGVIYGFLLLVSHSLAGLQISTPLVQDEKLYPETKPYQEGYLQVSDLHRIYYSEFGNPDGIPVLVVHGGPGWGCPPSWSSFFNPAVFRIIMFDQRGAMRSTPFAEMQENTPQLLISDMEQLRKYLGIDQWYLFGGSWGSTLSLLYSEANPDKVKGLVLRGIFLARDEDYLNLFYGMRNTFPDAWDEMVETLGDSEDSDLVGSLHDKIMNPDPAVHLKAARAFMIYDTICAFLLPNPAAVNDIQNNDKQALGVARAFIHYSANHFFLEENQVLKNTPQIVQIPTIIVQGRYDVICPMKQAYDLHKRLPNSQLWIIPDSGHSSGEPSIAKALKKAMDQIVGH